MRNLYVVNTPLHLFVAFILANYYTAGQENVLTIINPKDYSSWEKSRCIANICTDDTTWENVIVVTKECFKAQLKSKGILNTITEFKDKLNSSGKIDQVYLASDKLLVNQVIVELSGNTTFIRFDEGTASYIQPEERRTITKTTEYLLIQVIRRLAGLSSPMRYNFNGMGCGKAGTADYLFKPHMLERPSPKPIVIGREAISKALDKLLPAIDSYSEFCTGNIILYLGNVLSDRGKVDRNAELELIQGLSTLAEAIDYSLVYKPHPGESHDKLSSFAEQFPNMQFFNSFDPIEIAIYRYSNIRALIGAVNSSAMLYADLFAKHKIHLINASHLVGYGFGQVDYLIEKAGVEMPQDFGELERILTTT